MWRDGGLPTHRVGGAKGGPHVIAPAADESLVRRDRKGKAVGRAALPTQLRFKLLLAAVLALLSVGAVVSSVRVALIAQPLKLSQDACPAVPDGNGLLDGIVYICTGKGCDVSFLCMSLHLLRHASGWEGRIYIVTDRDEFLSGSACGGASANLNFTAVAAPETPTLMHMKNFKRQLFGLIEGGGHVASKLLYVDADILPVGCLSDFLHHESPDNLGMFLDSWCRECNHFLGGFLFMHKTSPTLACLDAWTAESSRDGFTKYVKDQDAFDQIRRDAPCADAVHTLSSRYIETFDDNMILPFFGTLLRKRPAFQHFSHGIRAEGVWLKIKASIDQQIHGIESRRLH